MFSMDSCNGLYWFAAGCWLPKFVNISTAGDSKYVPNSWCSQSPAPLFEPSLTGSLSVSAFFRYLGVFSLWLKIKFM